MFIKSERYETFHNFC